MDIIIVLLLVAAMVVIRAHAPSNTYSYAQFLQVRASIDQLNGGSLLFPKIDDTGVSARKPPLYACLLTAAMKLTGWNNNFIYRVPTLLAAAGVAVLTYLLGRRWYGRRAGLVAAVLWTTAMHMGKLIYLATTDMLLGWWIILCIFCVDRLTFHPCRPRRRWLWASGFWAAMILAAFTKGWGIVNVVIIGGFVALASATGGGFAVLRRARGIDKFPLALRLIGRRWWALLRRAELGGGMVVMLLLVAAGMLYMFVPIWLGWEPAEGGGFRQTAYREIWQRVTGHGAHAPHAARIPGVVHLYYNLLPASIFAGCALLLTPLRRWLGRRSPIALPLCWIIVVLTAFAIPKGFRPDYLLPCYPAVAILGGWAVMELSRPGQYDGKFTKHLRRICQAVPLVLGGAMIVVSLLYFSSIQFAVFGLGLMACGLGGWAIRRKRLELTVAATCACMLGATFLYTHFWTRQARTGDGDVMVKFADDIRPIVGGEDFAIYAAAKLGAEPYLGRFGRKLTSAPQGVIAQLNRPAPRWLITSDIGLLHLGAYSIDANGPVKLELKKAGRKQQYSFRTRPQDIGSLRVRSTRPIKFEKWGTIYLIELKRPVTPTSQPFLTGYISDPVR